MDMAEQYPSWASLSASSLAFPAPYTSPTEATDIPLHFLYGIENAGVCQTTHALPQSFEIKPDPPDRVDQDSTPPTRVKPLSPIDSPSPTLSEGRGLASPESNTSPEECCRKPVQRLSKRATQNREAQRRFRERRDQQNKSLQQRADHLQEKYDALEKRFNQKSDKISQLQGENNGLEREIQDLRRRWRIMVRLLQQPKSLQFLSMFVSGGSHGTSGLPIDDLDGYMRCLDALVFPDKT